MQDSTDATTLEDRVDTARLIVLHRTKAFLDTPGLSEDFWRPWLQEAVDAERAAFAAWRAHPDAFLADRRRAALGYQGVLG